MSGVPRMEPRQVVEASLADLANGVVVSIPGLADVDSYAHLEAADHELLGQPGRRSSRTAIGSPEAQPTEVVWVGQEALATPEGSHAWLRDGPRANQNHETRVRTRRLRRASDFRDCGGRLVRGARGLDR